MTPGSENHSICHCIILKEQVAAMNVHLRQHIRTALKCRIKISHPDFAEDILASTEDLSDTGVFVQHPALTRLKVGDVVYGQVQDMPAEAPVLMLKVMRITSSGAGFRFIQE